MICSKCGHDNAQKPHSLDPWCMYQVKDGKIINDLFLPHMIPEGWYDSPKTAKAAIEPKKDGLRQAESSFLGSIGKGVSKKVDGRTKQAKAIKAKLGGDSSGSD